jgi:hypothetical protein
MAETRVQQLLREVMESFQRQEALAIRAREVALGPRGTMEETVVQANGGVRPTNAAPTEARVPEAGEDEARARLAAMLASLGCGEVLARSIPVDTAQGDTMWHLAQLSEGKMAELFAASAAEMAAIVGEAVEAWKAGTTAAEEADAGQASGKFVDGKYGSLEGFVGLPDVHVLEAMIREHASTEKFTPSNNKGTRPWPPTP